jgi:2-keto-3-deoxy-L-rhamnonate aldolase RhmA
MNLAPATVSLKERMKTCLNDSSMLLGGFVFSTEPAMAEIYTAAGFDFVIIDMEHALNDMGSTVAHLRAARGAGIHALVRVGEADLSNIPRLLDAGCEGVFLPHLGMPGKGTSEAIRTLKYHPDGIRPTCTGVRAANYGLAEFGKVASESNRNILSVGMVEDAQCIENIEDILDTGEEVDWLMPGPADLSTSLGVHGRVREPIVLNAVDKVFRAAQERGIPVGMYINDPSELPEWRDKGAKFIVLSIDLKWLGRSLKSAAKVCKEAMTK